MNFLTPEQRTALRCEHKRERDRHLCDRIKAVLLYDKGWPVQKIAEALLLSDEAIRLHIQDYEVSQKLKPQSGGSAEKLSAENALTLDVHLQAQTYLSVGEIIAYVQQKFGILYTASGMRIWLHRHGFSYKKPAIIPGKANQQAQQEWIKNEYEPLRDNLPEDEVVCVIDGVHPTHNVQKAYGWIKKGVRKEILSNAGRSGINLSGAIDISSHNIVIQEDQTLDSETTKSFFKRREKSYLDKTCIHLFCDNARYDRNKAVQEWLKNSKIKLHFIPPYSPNLNPI